MIKALAAALALTLAIFAGSAVAKDKIKVGTTSGADVNILEKVVEIAKTKGLEVELVEFSDYQLPNAALAEGEIDLNSFQHIPFLDDFNKEKKTDLVSIGQTYISPIGFFSKKYKSLDELKDGDVVAIPNDASNGGRSLLLLQRAGIAKAVKKGDHHDVVGSLRAPYVGFDFQGLQDGNFPLHAGDDALDLLDGSAVSSLEFQNQVVAYHLGLLERFFRAALAALYAAVGFQRLSSYGILSSPPAKRQEPPGFAREALGLQIARVL